MPPKAFHLLALMTACWGGFVVDSGIGKPADSGSCFSGWAGLNLAAGPGFWRALSKASKLPTLLNLE